MTATSHAAELSPWRCPYSGEVLHGDGNWVVAERARRRYARQAYGVDFCDLNALTRQERYVAKLYSFLSSGYDLSIPPLLRVLGYSEHELRREILAKLDLKPGQRLLEIGIGTGANLIALSPEEGQAELFGVDISSRMLRRCRRRLAAAGIEAHLARATATALPFESATFDGVLCVGGFNSFSDKPKAVREMLRVARPGGRIVMNDGGLSPDARARARSKFMVKGFFWLFSAIERCDFEPPLEHLPADGSLEELEIEFPGPGHLWTASFRRAQGEILGGRA